MFFRKKFWSGEEGPATPGTAGAPAAGAKPTAGAKPAAAKPAAKK